MRVCVRVCVRACVCSMCACACVCAQTGGHCTLYNVIYIHVHCVCA